MEVLSQKKLFGLVNYFYPLNLFLIPYGEHTGKYLDQSEEGDVVGLFINMENA